MVSSPNGHWSERFIVRRFISPKIGPVVLRVIGSTGRYSEWSLVRQVLHFPKVAGPEGHWSEGTLVLRVGSPKVMIPSAKNHWP